MEECRKRVEAEMKNDPGQLKRMKDAKLKQKMFVDKFMLKQGAPNGGDSMGKTILRDLAAAKVRRGKR